MTGRDRIVLMSVIVLAVLGGGWLLLVSPERKQAASAQTQIESARQQLQSAQAQAASERSAEAGYAAAYVSVVKLGKAVPPQEEVPSLVYELGQATNQRSIDFQSITSGATAASSATSGSAAAAATAPAAFTQMPFTFVFTGSFFQLAHLLGQVDGFARTTSTGTSATTPNGVEVDGRLLTIQGVTLAPDSEGASAAGKASNSGKLTATITATAYVLPASQGLTGGATATGPAGAGAAASSAAASSSSSPASPAVIQGRP
ncbi:MAG TPA: type II secretion system protein GspM [Solirubrobacteraceae bacterium]|jgi:Tfp pilus assembly protein PilO